MRIGDARQGLATSNRPPVTFALPNFDDVDRMVEAAHAGPLTLVRANGFAPSGFMPASDAMSSAQAPSLMPDELPAVTEPLPSVRNAGRSLVNLVAQMRAGTWTAPDAGLREPREK